jgi:exopolysaccharide biosynthesis protein
MDGQINEGAYNANSGVASRSCIGQRADGSVVFLYTTGPLSGDAGATWQDCIDILYEYNCINACSLDSTAVMLHTDGNGTAAVGTDSPLRAESAMLPDVWVIRPGEEG